MLKKIILALVIISICIMPALAADAKSAKKGAGKSADWDVAVSLVDAVSKAKEEISEQYSNASAYSAVLKFSKTGKATYDVKFKISDVEDIKVSVSAEDGKCKVAKKPSKVGKSAIKNKDNVSTAKPAKGKKSKKAKAEEEDGGDEE